MVVGTWTVAAVTSLASCKQILPSGVFSSLWPGKLPDTSAGCAPDMDWTRLADPSIVSCRLSMVLLLYFNTHAAGGTGYHLHDGFDIVSVHVVGLFFGDLA